jgi:altronate dehydratase small subunit
VQKAIVMNPADNTATALCDLDRGDSLVLGTGVTEVTVDLAEAIAFGHKFALKAILKGDPVVKYGASIGRATADIAPGMHVHTHNLEGIRGRGDWK